MTPRESSQVPLPERVFRGNSAALRLTEGAKRCRNGKEFISGNMLKCNALPMK